MVRKAFILLIRLYQKFISPMKKNASCIFTPTCSSYAIESLEKHGFFKGMYLAVKRVLKCHPFHKGGYDPVP